MSDGHRPSYAPPTLGDPLERHGMKYDFEESSEPMSKRQRRNRNRNKNNRRDNNNRPPKEITMESSEKTNGAVESNKNNDASSKGYGTDIGAMVQVLERGLNQINGNLNDFGRTAITLSENMVVVAKDSTETRQEVRKLNAWNKENILGDVRKAVVQVGVLGAIGGVVALVTYAFKKDEEEAAATPTTSATNGAARPRATA